MISILTILLFFIYTWGLGFTATYFVNKPENALERFFVNVGTGLGVFAILSILLNFLHLPLDWKIFFVLSLVMPAYHLFKNPRFPQFKFTITKSTLMMLAVLALFSLSLFMYARGAFSYPYLEDEDPWGHAVGAKYVALEKNAYDPPVVMEGHSIDAVLSYIDPYPPAYDILIGILHQTSPDLNWTLKFFNALIISLSYVFFYLFAQLLMGSRNKALVATFILLAVPSYLSHFIWAHSLVVTLFFPTMYAFEKTREDKKWFSVAALLVAAIWVSQNLDQPVKLTTMLLLYLIIVSITQRKLFAAGFAALFAGLALSFLWWGAMIQKYTLKGFLHYFSGSESIASVARNQVILSETSSLLDLPRKALALLQKATSAGGSGSRVYNFNDFFFAQSQNAINNPIGIGIIITLLVFVGLLYILWKKKSALVTKENTWLCVVIFWLIFTFWGVMGKAFPISVARGTFRVWMLLAIPVSLIATEGLYTLKTFFSRPKALQILVVAGIFLGIIMTSFVPKYELNTAVWSTAGAFQGSPQEAFVYGQWFNSLPPNTNVFLYSPRDKLTIGFGMNSCDWCQDVIDFRGDIIHKDVQELHRFLQENEYEYFVINPRMESRYFTSKFGENETQQWLQQRYTEIANSELFTPIHQIENSLVVFRVN